MQLLPWKFEVCTMDVEEVINTDWSPCENVKALAFQKAEVVANRYPDQIVVGADTVVCYDGHIIGKPKDAQDAKAILRNLSGKAHQVYTGVAILCKSRNLEVSFYKETRVIMQVLSSEEIDAYVATSEPLDKAGAYGIQGYGARYIIGIEGDYYNVMGLPVHELYQNLKHIFEKM